MKIEDMYYNQKVKITFDLQELKSGLDEEFPEGVGYIKSTSELTYVSPEIDSCSSTWFLIHHSKLEPIEGEKKTPYSEMKLEGLGKAAAITVKQDLIPALEILNKGQQFDLVYQWVKTGYISKNVFKFFVINYLGGL